MSDRTQKALVRALYRMLRPMVRLLLRHGVSYRLFADIARHVYVDTAREDFAIPGRKQSLSRMAVLTGINRKDIAKMQERSHPLSDAPAEQPTPTARVITGWLNDVRFHSPEGEPATLPIDSEGDDPSFTALVRDYSRDVPVRALLDELERIDAVVREGGQVSLLVRGYIPLEDMQENIRIFGTAAADLMGTMDHNIAKMEPGPRIQRTVSYVNIPEELLERIRERSAREGQAFLLQVNDWLAECDREQSPELAGSGKVRAGIGLYYFEQRSEDVATSGVGAASGVADRTRDEGDS